MSTTNTNTNTNTDPFSFSSIFSQRPPPRLPDDTVFYSLFPDPPLSPESLDSLCHQILNSLTPFTSLYIWQHQPFTLHVSHNSLHGHLRYGDNVEDEWFVVFLLFHVSKNFPNLSIRVYDSDGEFLLIEAAFHLPRWLNPENSQNRVFIRCGQVHIIPKTLLTTNPPSLSEALKFLIANEEKTRADEAVQLAIRKRVEGYPERAEMNVMRVRVRIPVSVAQVLRYEPGLISFAVEGFYDRDIDSMKYAAKMERFLGREEERELVCVSVRMSRVMYAQLVGQKFQAPKGYPMPGVGDREVYKEAELGLKITCGFEMMYWMKKKEGKEGKGEAWDKYLEGLEKIGYFQGLLPGSKEYKRLMENAEESYRNSELRSRESETMSAPVGRIDEILELPHSADDFKGQEVPHSDDDGWLYGGEDELNSALLERQKEMELYNAKRKQKEKSSEDQDGGPSSSRDYEDFDLSNITKSMRAFVDKVSSYKGAEVPEDRNLREVDFDVDQFMKDMESVMRKQGSEGDVDDVDSEEEFSSDMDFDDSEDESDIAEPSGEKENEEDSFMHSYSDALNQELKNTTLEKSFVRASEKSPKKDEGPSNATEDMDEDFTPVDVDVNLVKNFLDSFSSQQGLPGPASNLLGLMGLQFPQDANKDK